MRAYIKSEFKRAIGSKNTLIAFILTIFSLLVAYLDFIQFLQFGFYGLKKIYDGVDIFIRIRCTTRASTLILFAPLLATLPFSNSYLLDKESGFLRLMYLKIDQKKYIWIKIIINAVVSGLVISLASFLILVFLVALYGIRNTNLNEVQGAFSSLFYQNKFFYSMLIIIISFIFSAIFSTLALGISPWIRNRYLTFIFPFFFYIISGTIFEYIFQITKLK